MRRFLLFGGTQYYASGGMNDFLSSHASAEDAVCRAKELESAGRLKAPVYCVEWWHVFDTEERKICDKSEFQAYGAENAGPSLTEFTGKAIGEFEDEYA